jgi:hypothetical protein
VLKVGVFHTAIVRGLQGVWGEPCASSQGVTGQLSLIPEKKGIAPPFGTLTNQLKFC